MGLARGRRARTRSPTQPRARYPDPRGPSRNAVHPYGGQRSEELAVRAARSQSPAAGSAPERALSILEQFARDHEFEVRERAEHDVQLLTDAALDSFEDEIRAGRMFGGTEGWWKPLPLERRRILTRRLRLRRIVYEQRASDVILTVEYPLDGACPLLLSYEIWTDFTLVDEITELRGDDAEGVHALNEDLLWRLDPETFQRMKALKEREAEEWREQERDPPG